MGSLAWLVEIRCRSCATRLGCSFQTNDPSLMVFVVHAVALVKRLANTRPSSVPPCSSTFPVGRLWPPHRINDKLYVWREERGEMDGVSVTRWMLLSGLCDHPELKSGHLHGTCSEGGTDDEMDGWMDDVGHNLSHT